MNRNIDCEIKISNMMNNGFKKAEDSFSRFLGHKVALTNINNSNSTSDLETKITLEGDSVYILITELIGDLSGKSYLLISETESNVLFEILSKQFNSPMTTELKKAMLLEIDNIISASVITEISNNLGIKLYGSVPSIKELTNSQLTNSFGNEFKIDNGDKLIYYTSSIQIDNFPAANFKFIWKLSSKIMNLMDSKFGSVSSS